MITCPNCGEMALDEVLIYNENLRKQDFRITPVLPTCKLCGAEADVFHKCGGGNIIVLTGTCGSGKSTIAEIFMQKGFAAMDGDCIMQTVKHKRSIARVEFNDMFDEVACQIDILSLVSDNLVLSHVILPEDLDRYIEIFRSRNLKYTFFLLKPDYQVAVERCRTRTCHTSITPEYWIKHFHETLEFDDRVKIVDNGDMSAEETAEYILANLD